MDHEHRIYFLELMVAFKCRATKNIDGHLRRHARVAGDSSKLIKNKILLINF